MADLWTHVDIGRTISDSQIKLLLDWSKDNPIHVHAFEPDYTPFDHEDEEEKYEHAAREMMKPLQPHLHRLHTLSIYGANDGEFISVILNLWSNCGYVDTPAFLLAEGPECSLAPVTVVRNQGKTYENLERMLLAVSNLHLDNARFDWTSSAYRGLVDLRLSLFPMATISSSQLFSILSSCPALHTLKLGNLAVIRDVEARMQPDPVLMECLEVLQLTSMEANSVGWVLSLTTLPEFRAELSISVDLDSMEKRLAGVLTRSKFATFYWYCSFGFSTHTPWKYLLKHLPRSHTLVLHSFHLTPETWLGVSIDLSEFLPLFHSVVFLRCELELEVLKRFVVLLEPQELRFELCSSFNTLQDMEYIRSSLLKTYPELRCSISDTDSTKKIACRTI
ncbi:hypothetical protein FRC12_011283 [Ceratobasidium sp. 428]|nr:hypothetical protein FRC12_011283 [Ceratobasidium sp. 428]